MSLRSQAVRRYSLECLLDVLTQVRIRNTPDLAGRLHDTAPHHSVDCELTVGGCLGCPRNLAVADGSLRK